MRQELSVVTVAELPLVVSAAAALGLFPPPAAERWADSVALPEELARNYYEIANVLSQVIREDRRRCVVNELTLYAPSERIVGDDLVPPPFQELTLAIKIPAYGEGRIAIVEETRTRGERPVPSPVGADQHAR
jgi:hypothetical protein